MDPQSLRTSPIAENTLLVHERHRPDGQRRLVIVECGGMYNGKVPHGATGIATLFGRVIVPGGVGHDPRCAVAFPDYSHLTKVGLQPGDAVLPGVVDPRDPTRFTVPIRRGNTQVIVNGWLKDDDTVVFDPQWVWFD